MKKICGIYLIISPNNRRYVWSSVNIFDRWKRYKRLGCKSQPLLFRSFEKYGVEAHRFIILYECFPDERLKLERIFGDLYLSLFDFGGLNNHLPTCDERPQVFSKEMRKNISITLVDYFSVDENRKRSSIRFKKFIKENPETFKEMQEKSRVARMTDASRIKRKAIAIKNSNNPEWRSRHSSYMKKRFSDPEEIRLQSERTKRYMSLPEVRERNRKNGVMRFENIDNRKNASEKTRNFFKNNPDAGKRHSEFMKELYKSKIANCSKSVLNNLTGEIFSSIKKAADSIGMNNATLSDNLNGRTKINNTPFIFKLD